MCVCVCVCVCKIAYIVVCILLVYSFHVQCVGSSPSVISNNSAIVNAKHILTDSPCTQTAMKEVRENQSHLKCESKPQLFIYKL